MSKNDRSEELIAVLESLADWLDGLYEEDWSQSTQDADEHVAAVAQVIELTQLLMGEYIEMTDNMNALIGTLSLAKQEAERGTKLIVAHAGDMSKYIKP